MPLTKLRRPKFERHDIKQNLYTIQLSFQRLNKIQRLLKEKDIDGLLIVIGIDGRFNSGSLEAFNYLLFDVYGTRKDDMDRSKLDEDVFDDVMICVQIDEVHIYCNGANYWLLLPYIGHWPGLRLHCITEIEMEDPDKMEEFKMKTFVEMTRNCNTIGVSTKASYELNGELFDPMQLEDWPIVQSYAYDDFGKHSHDNAKKGFFTLVHKVVDLSHEVSRICRQIDPVCLESVFTKILPQMEGLFENIFQLMDTKCCSTEFQINEDTLEEPVKSYYSHYKGVKVALLHNIKMCPFVLAGPNTTRRMLEDKMVHVSQSGIRNGCKQVKNPTHIIIQCVSLQAGIVITRTSFVNYSFSSQAGDSQTAFINENTRELSRVYNIIVETVENTIDNIKKELHFNSDATYGEKCLKSMLEDTEYSDFVFRIQRVDDGLQKDSTMIIIQAVVYDICIKATRENLGSVMFADTFVVCCAPLRKDEELNSVLRLGKEIPIFNYWTDQRLSGLHNRIRDVYHLDSLGTENVDIFLPNNDFHEDSTHSVCCTFYVDRVLLFNRRIGASLIYPVSIEIFEGESYGDWTICTIKFKKDESSCNWIWNRSYQSSLHLVFNNHSSIRKFITNVVIPKWKAQMTVIIVEKLSHPQLKSSWEKIQFWMSQQTTADADGHNESLIDGISDESNKSSLVKCLQSMISSVANKRSCFRIFCRLMEIAYSLHYLDSLDFITDIPRVNMALFDSLELCWSNLPIMDQKKLTAIIRPPATSTTSACIIVTVLCGLPGSGHDVVAKKITKLIREDVSWILVSARHMDDIGESISRGIDRFTELESANIGKQMRMILVAPPLSSPSLVCNVLASISTSIPLTIGSTCFCVDPQSAYLDGNQFTIPGLLDMCTEGWVTCILLTGADDNSQKTNTLHRLLHSKNALCTIFRTPKAEVNKELDTILSPVAFQQSRFALSRILIGNASIGNNFSHKGIRKIAQEFFEVTYLLCGKLSKENIMVTCQEIFKNLQTCPFERNIYFIDGVFGIQEDPAQIFTFTAVALTKQVSFLPHNGGASIFGNSDNYVRVYMTSPHLNTVFDNAEHEKIEYCWHLLLTLIEKFQRHRPNRKPRLSLPDLSKVQIDGIHKAKHLDALPEGWFYNGQSYVHMDGARSDKHPSLERFIEEFLRRENETVEEYNSAIEKMSFTDSFCKA